MNSRKKSDVAEARRCGMRRRFPASILAATVVALQVTKPASAGTTILAQSQAPVSIVSCSVVPRKVAAKPGNHGYVVRTHLVVHNRTSSRVDNAIIALFGINGAGDILFAQSVSMGVEGGKPIPAGTTSHPFDGTETVTTTIDSDVDRNILSTEGTVCAVMRVIGPKIQWDDDAVRLRFVAHAAE